MLFITPNSSFSKNDCGNSAENLAANIQILTGLTVNHFASFDFEGFEKIIDSFSGIEICVDKTQREGFSFELQEGCQTVEGSTALNWVVSRNTEVLVGEKVIDKNGKSLRNSIIWCDGRAVEIGNKAFSEIGSDKCSNHLLNFLTYLFNMLGKVEPHL